MPPANIGAAPHHSGNRHRDGLWSEKKALPHHLRQGLTKANLPQSVAEDSDAEGHVPLCHHGVEQAVILHRLNRRVELELQCALAFAFSLCGASPLRPGPTST